MPVKPFRNIYKSIFAFCFLALAVIVALSYQDLLNWYLGYEIKYLKTEISPIVTNSKGQTIVSIYKKVGDSSSLKKVQTAIFNFSDSSLKTITSPDETKPNCRVAAINSSGFSVGTVTQSQEEVESTQAVIWKDNTPIEMFSSKSNKFIEPRDINNSNEVVGTSFKNITSGFLKYPAEEEAFYWSKNKGVVSLTQLIGRTRSRAKGINDSGMIIGDIFETDRWKSFFLEKGKVYMIDYPETEWGTRWVMARNINNRGEVLVQNMVIDRNPTVKGDNIIGVWTKSKGFKKISGTKEIKLIASYGIDDHGRLLIEGESNSARAFYIYDSGEFKELPELKVNPTPYYDYFTNNGFLLGYTGNPFDETSQRFILKLLR